MNRLVLYMLLVIGLAATLQKSNAQLIYFSDANGQLFTVDINSGGCDVNSVGQMLFNGVEFIATDIAFHPNGVLYATNGEGLYEVNTTSLVVTYIGPHNTASGIDFINALVCDSDGILYGADTKLFTININNGSATNLGDLPCESAGDLAFNNNELYLACQANELLKIDINNTGASQIVGTMSAINLFFGIVTFATECSDVQTFGTAGSSLYQIDVGDASNAFICNLIGANEVYGAAMETDFIASDCELIVDLDGDNSSGALEYDYFADTLCGNNMSPIVDADFNIIAELEVDSMVIKINAGILDGVDEQLILTSADNMNIYGSGTNHLLLESTGDVEVIDLAHVLENTMYVNMANPYTPGTREITVQFFGEGEESNIATAFITLIQGVPFSIDLGADSILCEGETLVLDANYAGAISYEWNDGSMESTLGVVANGMYTVTVTDDCGITASDEILVEFLPPVEFLDLGDDLVLCPGESYELDASLIDGVDYEWNDGSTNPMLTVIETGVYAVSVTTSCGVQTGDVFIEFQEVPIISIFPDDTLACQGESILLNATLPDALAYNWQDGSTEPILEVDEAGYYQVTVSFECGTYLDDIFVNYNDYDLTVDLGRDTTFCFEDSIVLNANTIFASTFQWQDGSTEPYFIVKESGNYALTVSDGCTTEEDQIFIRMKSCCNVFVPNVFSPNFDGANDEFKTFSNCTLPVFDLQVFNRWGAIVFQSNEQSNTWDGTINGQKGQEGVYVWVLRYNDGLEDQVLAGDVTLIR